MTVKTFRALVARKEGESQRVAFETLDTDALPAGDVLVKIDYSTVNYKDGLGVTGKGPIFKSYPMVPGIDFAGSVVESQSPAFKPGDAVLLDGFGVGESHWGGFAQYARVKSEWLVPIPKGLDAWGAMAIGTAGFTAMLSVMALEEHGLQKDKEVCVTGAAGGVGSFAIFLLAKLGCKVVAVSGRPDTAPYLQSLGAAEVVGRDVLAPNKRPLQSMRWGGAIDSVGGDMLASLLAQMNYGATVAACGLAGGMALNTTVAPFILRGVALQGIDSVNCPMPRRVKAWERLSTLCDAATLRSIATTVQFDDLPKVAADILAGTVRGRVVVALS